MLHEYGCKNKPKKAKSWELQQIPMYTRGEDTSWRYPVEKGKSTSSTYKEVLVHVWSDSISMSGPMDKLLSKTGLKLKKNILREMDLL